ncbi:hypothetical protein GGR51DRAFT_570720 [Nemania sp. FL0031]|nr:hypothetical protein GGR51DRAFT_570720 [Nemania sp. FL0031]
MQSQTPQEEESAPPGKRSTSFGKLIKKAFGKKDKSSSSSTTPVPVTPALFPVPTRPKEADGYMSRPFPTSRRLNPTEEDLHDNVISLQTALNDTWPRRQHSRYRNARALLVCWADNMRSEMPMVPNSPTGARIPSYSLFPAPARSSSASNATSVSRVTSGASRVNSSGSIAQEAASLGPFIPAAYQLASVLEHRYGIQSQVWLIPTVENPHEMLHVKVKQFVDDFGSSAENLLLFWYGGHAEFVSTPSSGSSLGRDKNPGDLVWYGLRDERGVPARAITKVLGNARADVLILNDSPFSQHAYTSHIAGPGTFELLGSGLMSPSYVEPNPSREGSFTRTLILMLDSAFLADHGVSVLELHRKLIDMMSPKSSALDVMSQHAGTPETSPAGKSSANKPPANKPPVDKSLVDKSPADKSPADKSPTETSPAETSPTDAGSKASSSVKAETSRTRTQRRSNASLIVAHAPKPAQIAPYPIYCQISQFTQLERDTRRNIVLSRLDKSLAIESNYARNVVEPRIKLDIQLERYVIDVRRWREWLLRAPEEAKEVAVFPGGMSGTQPA